jgi:short-subunit dehydrogenase
LFARKQKSAIVVTSSVGGARPIGGCSIVYSATKSLVSFLSVGLSYELEGKVDVMTWECGYVSTKLSREKEGGLVLNTKDAVAGMLRDIGKENLTNGRFVHELTKNAFMAIPLYYLNRFTIKMGTDVLRKQRARDPQVMQKKQI